MTSNDVASPRVRSGALSDAQTVKAPSAPRRFAIWLPLVLLAVVPLISSNPYLLSVWTFILLSLIVVIGLDLLVGYSGQLSLGHGVFVTIGGYASALLTTKLGWNGWSAIPAGMIASGIIAFVIGVPTLRLRGYYLAMATLGFPVVLDAVLRNWSNLTGGSSGVTGVPLLAIGNYILKGATAYYYFAWMVVCIVFFVARLIAHSRFGLSLKAIHADESAAAARGIDIARAKIAVFVVSAVVAAFSGSLYVHYVQFIAPDTFGVLYSIMLVVMLVVGGAGRLWGGVLGTIVLMWLPELLRSTSTWEPIVFGAVLAVVMLRAPKGIAGLWARRAAILYAAQRETGAAQRPDQATRAATVKSDLLVIDNLKRNFGGIQAVGGLNYRIAPGQIKAIIGPNGAGKSTVLALIAGTFPPSAGFITFAGRNIEALPAHTRARLGIGRTFQHVRLIPDLTVIENITLGLTAIGERDPRDDRHRSARDAIVGGLVGRLGLADVADAFPGQINQYQCRLVELGAALAGDPRLLLLDEPAAGLSTAEIDQLATILRAERECGRSIILVDHVMQLVMSIAEEILVLEYGTALAQGKPAEIVSDARVRAAYLGTRNASRDGATLASTAHGGVANA